MRKSACAMEPSVSEQSIDAMRKSVLTLDVMLAKEIEYRIETGRYTEGQRIPSERELADTFGLQRGTVRNAIGILEDKGVLVSRERAGHYVAPRRIDFDLDAYNSRKVVIERMGISTSVMLLTFEKISVSGKMSEETGWPVDTPVFRIMRLRYAAGIPMALERAHIKCDLAPGLTEEDVNEKSLYESLAVKYNEHVSWAESKVTAVSANGLESILLNIKVSRPVMRYEGLVYDREGRLLEFFDDIILKDQIQFISNDR